MRTNTKEIECSRCGQQDVIGRHTNEVSYTRQARRQGWVTPRTGAVDGYVTGDLLCPRCASKWLTELRAKEAYETHLMRTIGPYWWRTPPPNTSEPDLSTPGTTTEPLSEP